MVIHKTAIDILSLIKIVYNKLGRETEVKQNDKILLEIATKINSSQNIYIPDYF